MTAQTAQYDEHDPRYHADNIRRMLDDLANHCRQDAAKVAEPKAQALFETTAEVLKGISTAYEHYQSGIEPAMQAQPAPG